MSIVGVTIDLIWVVAAGGALLFVVLLALLIAKYSSSRALKRSGNAHLPLGKVGHAAGLDQVPEIMENSAGQPLANQPPIEMDAEVNLIDDCAIEGDFENLRSWTNTQFQAPLAQLVGNEYLFNAYEGAVSVRSLNVTSGERVVTTYSVRVERPPTNGVAPRYVVGACFTDQAGAVISWGAIGDPLFEGTRTDTIEALAPEGSVKVQLCVCGYWAPETPGPDGQLAFSNTKLRILR
jgi:hypothetical protein